MIGPIRVGTGSGVAANAVVLDVVQPYSLVVGVPAVVKRIGLDVSNYKNITRDNAG